MRVLVVEPDTATAASIALMLKRENIVCDITDLGDDVIIMTKHYDYDVITLEMVLADTDGFCLIRTLRAAQIKTPILVLSGLDGIDDKVMALDSGADDYLTKPFYRRELVARIKAIVRRSRGYAEAIVNTGKLTVNLVGRIASVDGKKVHITGKEYGILELLSLRKKSGNPITKEMFLDHLYGGIDEPELKIIDVFVCKLRKKIAAENGGVHYIETVWGRGYVLKDPKLAIKPVSTSKAA